MSKQDPHERWRDHGDQEWLARRLTSHAERAEARGEPWAAAKLIEAVGAILEALGDPPEVVSEPVAPSRGGRKPGSPWGGRLVTPPRPKGVQ